MQIVCANLLILLSQAYLYVITCKKIISNSSHLSFMLDEPLLFVNLNSTTNIAYNYFVFGITLYNYVCN